MATARSEFRTPRDPDRRSTSLATTGAITSLIPTGRSVGSGTELWRRRGNSWGVRFRLDADWRGPSCGRQL